MFVPPYSTVAGVAHAAPALLRYSIRSAFYFVNRQMPFIVRIIGRIAPPERGLEKCPVRARFSLIARLSVRIPYSDFLRPASSIPESNP